MSTEPANQPLPAEAPARNVDAVPRRTILGINFLVGSLEDGLGAAHAGGLIVVPSGPNLADMADDPEYTEAVVNADWAITDSGYMVLLWWLKRREKLERLSGLRFLRGILEDPVFRERVQTQGMLWVMPSEAEAQSNRAYLESIGLPLTEEAAYVAPYYPMQGLKDSELLERARRLKPAYIFLCVAGGKQEKLGYYLRRNLEHTPAIMGIGAAIAFLTGAQAGIPPWADRLYLGWLWRCFQNPKKFIARYWRAKKLATLLLKHGERCPIEVPGR
ncbi:MAG: WecB/TagA/CpsF family glycosyltransferase [Opitutales bacterium]